ncbi:IcmT/TraK family protein [Pseudomonas aeruginosa]
MLHYITKNPKVGPVDAKIVFPALIFIMHPRLWTTIVFLLCVLILWYLSMKGIRLDMIGRIFRSMAIGRKRQIRPAYREHFKI